jgi:hypothetical protein
VTVRTGAWNTGWHHGVDFLQWTGSQLQKDALQRLHDFSADLHATEARAKELQLASHAFTHALEQARWRLLRAETSCNLFWGEAWVHRLHEDLDGAALHLQMAKGELPEESAETGTSAEGQPATNDTKPTRAG